MANWGLIFGLIIGVVSTILIVWMGNIKEEYLKREVASTQERAAEANARASEADLARLRLEEKLAPRTLSLSQRTGLVKKLTAFAGAAVDVVEYPSGTSDIAMLTDAIYSVLKESGWKTRYWKSLGSQYVIGVGVATVPGSDKTIEAAANALIEGLNAAGIVAVKAVPLTDHSFPMPAVGDAPVGNIAPIRMYIGTKP